MNTKITYQYIDTDGYRVRNEAILYGRVTAEQKGRILRSLYKGEYFVPELVGLPAERLSARDGGSDSYFELSPYGISDTDEPPTVCAGPEEIACRFEASAGLWIEAKRRRNDA